MATITLAIPDNLRKKMRKFNEINWSAVSRNAIKKKIEEQETLNKLLAKELKETEWTIKLGQDAKKGRAKKLKEKGYDL